MDAVRQEDNIEGAISTVKQSGANEIEDRAEKREEKIPQRRLERLGTTVQANQRHRGEGHQFERDIQGEKIAAEKDGIQRTPDR